MNVRIDQPRVEILDNKLPTAAQRVLGGRMQLTHRDDCTWYSVVQVGRRKLLRKMGKESRLRRRWKRVKVEGSLNWDLGQVGWSFGF